MKNFFPISGTFLNFVSYAAGAIRMAALSHQRLIIVATHDSIGLGEDGVSPCITVIVTCRCVRWTRLILVLFDSLLISRSKLLLISVLFLIVTCGDLLVRSSVSLLRSLIDW